MSELYYTPPAEEQFEEMKAKATTLWKMGYEPSWAEKKIGRIKDIANVGDNFMYMVAMFDVHNQKRLANSLSAETRLAVRERLIDGGSPEEFIFF